jgi:hypothetical protein
LGISVGLSRSPVRGSFTPSLGVTARLGIREGTNVPSASCHHVLSLRVVVQGNTALEAASLRESGDSRVWHLARPNRPFTLCGLTILYGDRRQLWAEVPEGDRCVMCVERLRMAP